MQKNLVVSDVFGIFVIEMKRYILTRNSKRDNNLDDQQIKTEI